MSLRASLAPARAHACTYIPLYVKIAVDWGEGTTTTHYEFDSYAEVGEAPDLVLFENAAAYNAHPSNNYTFAQLAGGNNWAILSEELKFGLDQMINQLDGMVPVLSSAYRSPNQNTSLVGSAKCSSHTYGRAADLSIRDPFNGNDFSCTMWNLFVEASDNWVEPWEDTIANGATPHFHIDFSRPGNDPGTCTGYP